MVSAISSDRGPAFTSENSASNSFATALKNLSAIRKAQATSWPGDMTPAVSLEIATDTRDMNFWPEDYRD